MSIFDIFKPNNRYDNPRIRSMFEASKEISLDVSGLEEKDFYFSEDSLYLFSHAETLALTHLLHLFRTRRDYCEKEKAFVDILPDEQVVKKVLRFYKKLKSTNISIPEYYADEYEKMAKRYAHLM